MTKLGWMVKPALAAAAVLAALWWAFASTPQVRLVAPVIGNAAQVVYATGVVEPEQWSKVASLSRKRIVELCRCEGKAVKKGEILGRLDDVEERALLTELQARQRRVQEDVDRLRGLVERNVTSRVTYEEKLTQLREFDARVAAQMDRISDLELRAPMDGIVLRRDGEVGEIAGTGNNDVLLWVGQPKPLRIVADINEDDIVKVAVGQKVLLRHDSQSGQPLTATVASITPKGDPATRTFRAYLRLPDDTPLQIGMSVEANIVVREAANVLLVPAEAVSDGKVMLVEAGRLRATPVTLGIRGTTMIEIKAGLKEGQPIVSPVPATLREGARVKAMPVARP